MIYCLQKSFRNWWRSRTACESTSRSIASSYSTYKVLWVNLQLEHLCRTSRREDDQELKQALDRLPQGLVAMYTRILDEIADGDEHIRKVALECFRWMIYAKEPLSLEVLRVTVTLLKTPRTARELMLRLLPSDYVVEECRNLIRLSGTGTFGKLIHPIHFSFLEYIQSLPLSKLKGDFWDPLMDAQGSESILACRCIDWLLLALPDDWEQSDTWITRQRLSYPTRFFDKHAMNAISGSGKPPSGLSANINRLLSIDTGKLASLVKLRLRPTPLGQWKEGRDFDEALSRNYLLWTSDLYLFQGLDSKLTELEIPKYALHFAVWFRPDQLQQLLSSGHCVNELDACQQSPLSYACAKGCSNSVEVLLRAGARLEADSWRTSPLGLAIQNDHFELTKMLLEANSSICARSDAQGLIALMMAVSLSMVQLLCETHDFDLNATDHAGRSVLSYYIRDKTPPYVKSAEATRISEYLIDRGANMYAKSKAGMSLLDYAACRLTGEEPLKFLLQQDPKLADKETNEWNSLHWNCRKGSSTMAKILLEHGLKVKKVTTLHPPKSWTPYEVMMHYNKHVWDFHESLTALLGRSEESRISANLLPEKEIQYSLLKVTEVYTKCSLCAISVTVRMIHTHARVHRSFLSFFLLPRYQC